MRQCMRHAHFFIRRGVGVSDRGAQIELFRCACGQRATFTRAPGTLPDTLAAHVFQVGAMTVTDQEARP